MRKLPDATNRALSVREPDAIVEFVPLGAFVRVSAIDPESLTEVSIVGPVKATRHDLERAVMRKLAFVLGKRA
jgi:hypothetical protein